MAIRYLIDGYNLLYALPEMPPGSWEEKREKLLDFLLQRRPQGKNPATLVFDSREGLGDLRQKNDLTIEFTAGETADDRIGAMVREHPSPRSLIVISNDQGVRALVSGTGAKFMTATDFLKAATPRPSKDVPHSAQSDTAQKITEEFKEKWL